MNSVCLIGRTVAAPEVKRTTSGTAFVKFKLAVDREYKKEGEQNADFISCTAFGTTAENMGKYVGKGYRIAVRGRITTGSYKNKDGDTVYTTDVTADRVEFLESRKTTSDTPAALAPSGGYGMPEGYSDGIPAGFSAADDDIPF